MTERIRLIGLPGTGKTTRLLSEINDMIENNSIKQSDIIFCSHSNASVNEAKHRIQRDYGYHKIQFTTMHKLAKIMVTQFHGLRYLPILDNTNENVSLDTGLEENPIIEFLRTLERKYNNRAKYQSLDKYEKAMISELSTFFRIKNVQLEQTDIEKIVLHLKQMYIPQETENLTYNHASDPRIGGVFNDLRNDLFVGLYNLIQIIETAWALELKPENSKKLIKLHGKFLKYQSKISPQQLSEVLLHLKSMLTIYRNGAYSFNQVLFEALNYKLIPDGTVLIIDEYQDIGKLQFDLSELWAENMKIFLVAGDPNQSIYGFNGVSPDFLENFKFDKEITLTSSYRVPSKVIEYSQKIYINHWTSQMSPNNDRVGKVIKFNIQQLVNHLFDSVNYETIFILCRSEDIMQFIQLQLLEFGLYNPRKEFSFDLMKAIEIRDLFQDTEKKINLSQFGIEQLKSFLQRLEDIETKYEIKLSTHFNRAKISQLIQSQINDSLLQKDIIELNLINNPKFVPTVISVPKEANENGSINLGKLKKFHAKRIISKIYELTVSVEKNNAGLQELEQFVKFLQGYEKRLKLPITELIETDKIDKWKYDIKYRNFRNSLDLKHLERFNITLLQQKVEPFAGNSSNGRIQKTTGEYIHLSSLFMKNHPEIIKRLNQNDRKIYSNTSGMSNTLTTLKSLRRKIKFLTMHGAKGREADCVIIPNMKTFYEEKHLTDPEESKRVYFVATTRTKKDLIILEDNKFPKKESQFLPKV